jgi:hypothetical protein
MNLKTCNFCVWGFKSGQYNSFRHILEAFYRALKSRFPERQVSWLDAHDDISHIDFSNTFFISMEYAIKGMPLRSDCFYAVHNMEARSKEYTKGFLTINYGLYVDSMEIPSNAIELSRDTYFFPQPWDSYDAVVFRWATDLLPHEIMTNKPGKVFRDWSLKVNYVGTSVPEQAPFAAACKEGGIEFNLIGGFGGSPVSVEENVRLVQSSYVAPAISLAYQNAVGYLPCRVFKALSYGQMCATNNSCANAFFKGRLIYNADPRALFYDAREQLNFTKPQALYALMDEVARDHTYLNKIDSLLAAAKLAQESR